MSLSIVANINPSLLIWARKEQGYDIQFVSHKLRFPFLELWEKGEKKPSFSQILKLAHFYKRPGALFFMSGPPVVKKNKCVDFRAIKQTQQELSPETRTEIRICESRRKIALEIGESLGISSACYLPSISLTTDIENAVLDIREKMEINQDDIHKCRNDKEALKYWIQKLELQNILIFKSITLNGWNPSYKEIRGTSSYSPEYPWILINSQEHEREQLFTFGHELAHILLKGSGICTLDEENAESSLALIEQFCNKFSAAFHVPQSIFQIFRKQKRLEFSNKKQVDNAVMLIRKYFHISNEAAARRLYSLRYATKNYYLSIRRKQILDPEKARQRSSSGGDGTKYYKRIIQWNGMKYTHLVFEALHENIISLGKTAHFLRTDVKHVESIEREILLQKKPH